MSQPSKPKQTIFRRVAEISSVGRSPRQGFDEERTHTASDPRGADLEKPIICSPIMAGDPNVYFTEVSAWNLYSATTFSCRFQRWPLSTSIMIGERVSPQGVIRPLEDEAQISALQQPEEKIGRLGVFAIRRYCAGKRKFDKKFASTIKTVEKRRVRNMKRARQDELRAIAKLLVHERRKEREVDGQVWWGWTVAWDGDEQPPPSSIVSRRDTRQARCLAQSVGKALS